jgi:uncharacterized protein involved in exopolysaccharide biosynthesis
MKLVPSLYKSTVEILVFDSQLQIDATVQKPLSPFVDPIGFEAMSTEINIIMSKSVALRVAAELGLDRNPEFQPQNRLARLAERLGFLRRGHGVGPLPPLRIGQIACVTSPSSRIPSDE